MNKLLLTTAIAMAMGSSAAFAHHPAADIVDADVYEMIEENISDVHLDMTFDDMGGDTTDVGSAAEARDADAGNAGVAPGGDLEDVGAEMSGDLEDVGAAMESREVESSMADVEPSGTMSAQR
jgi:hypothetical protein